MKKYAFGLDLGGTTCKVGLFETDGVLLEKWEVPTDTSCGGANILKSLAEAVLNKMKEKNIASDDVEGVGIGVPGPVDMDGVVNKCVNLGWGVTPVEKELSALTGLKVKAGNDANVAALGEAWMGAGKNFRSIVMLTLGTGIGGGVVIDGKVLAGAHGAAGEVGHITVDKTETEVCGCGRCGCIEQYASATGFARLARRAVAKNSCDSKLMSVKDITAKDVFDFAKEGDELSLKVIDEACELLTTAMASIAEVVDPEAFVIGGGVSKAGNILIDSLKEKYPAKVFHACTKCDILTATLGNDAGMYGAVKLLL